MSAEGWGPDRTVKRYTVVELAAVAVVRPCGCARGPTRPPVEATNRSLDTCGFDFAARRYARAVYRRRWRCGRTKFSHGFPSSEAAEITIRSSRAITSRSRAQPKNRFDVCVNSNLSRNRVSRSS